MPEIRLSGVSGDWEERKLSDMLDFSNGINAPKESYGKGRKMISVMDVLDESPITYKNIRNSVEVNKDIEDKNRVEKGDLIFVRSSEVVEEVGWTRAYLADEYALYSGFTIRGKKKNEYDAEFIELNLNSTSRRQIERKAGGSTRFNVSQSILNSIVIRQPHIEEQTKLGNLFKHLDDTIAIHQQELDTLQQTKQGFLQKMFPKKGETVPEIRFPGFTGDWVKCKLNELVTPIVREVPKPDRPYKRISIRSHAKGTFRQKVDDPKTVSMKKLYEVKENDLIVNITFAWEHAIAVASERDDGLLVSHRFPTFVIDKSDINFIRYTVIQEDFRRKMELISPGGAGRNRVLNKKDFVKLKLSVPNEIEEQQKIGDFFKQLDDIIALHEQELDTLKQTKKAFLQKMFV